jgi:hypothetical protein
MHVTVHKILMIPLNSGVTKISFSSKRKFSVEQSSGHFYRSLIPEVHSFELNNAKKINLASFKNKFSYLLKRNGEFYMNYT